jgi:hypothetical protein
MPESEREGNSVATLPAHKRKAAKMAARRAELEGVAPVLTTIPWRNIKAGYTRLRDIGDFIRFYQMYAPLLAGHKDILVRAKDSGKYEFFDLHATAGGIVVNGIDKSGRSEMLFKIKKDYWEDEYSPMTHFFSPF